MFKYTSEGSTHNQNDGWGESEWEERFNKLCEKHHGKPLWNTTSIIKDDFKTFIQSELTLAEEQHNIRWGIVLKQAKEKARKQGIEEALEAMPESCDTVTCDEADCIENLKQSIRNKLL